MSVPVLAVHPISLTEVSKIILTTQRCIGSPFAGSNSCSQPLSRSPGSKRLPNAKEKLVRILGSMKDDIIAITEENISSLKYIAKSCTCSDHQKLSANFAHHWLASPRLTQFLNHMSWSTDVTKWRCLASANLSCPSMLACLNSTEIHHEICGFLNKMAIGVESHKSLLQLARHWSCGKHQEDDNIFSAMVDNLWQDCRKYWKKLGRSPRRQRISGLKVALETDPKEDSSQAGDSSLLSESSNATGSTEDTNIQGRHESSPTLRPDTDQEAGLERDATPPWNDQNLYERDSEDETMGDSDPLPIQYSQSPENLPIAYSQIQIGLSDSMQPPGMFPREISLTDGEPAPAPATQRAPLTSTRVESHPCPQFKQYGSGKKQSPFNNLFRRLIEKPPSHSDGICEGYIYVLQSERCPGYVKVGRTEQPNDDRIKQIEKCAGPVLAVKDEYSSCRVLNDRWLETTILVALGSRRRSFACPRCKPPKITEHKEWVEEDANLVAEHVEQWRQWMKSEPYGEDGKLSEKWQRRIKFFETFEPKYQYLRTPGSPCKAWSIFLDPPWYIRSHMAIYDEFLSRRGKVHCRWIRIQRKWKQIICDAASVSAMLITLLLYAGVRWISAPMTLIFIFLGVSCTMIWRL